LFEGQVGAYYLVSMLAGGEPRGLPGTIVTRIEFQRASERPLDDVIIHATNGHGKQAVLEVQVKRTIDFIASDLVFRELVAQVAKAAVKPEFDTHRYELAVATERTSTKIERSYQEVLSWARELGTAETFFSRLRQKRLANSDMRKFVENFRANLKLAGALHDDPAVWRILRRFQILVFDFNQEGSSTEILVRDRCGMLLAPEDASKVNAFWQTLVTLTLESAAKGGEKTPAQLRETLVNEYHYHFAGDRQLANARAALQEASFGALQDISVLVGSVHVDRAAHIENFYASLDKGRYVEIRGASGVGKSGVLKHIAEQISLEARVIVLSPARTLPHGWLSLQATLGCTASARDFLSDLASDGGAVLFIDGVDIFEDEDKKTTVRDLVRAAASVPNFSLVVTARGDFGKDEPSWLPKEALDALGRAPAVLIDDLNADEIDQLSDADPSLASLLADKHPAREVTRNLFRLARLAGRATESPVPASEAAMAEQWWKTGDGGETGRRERTRLLRTLSEQSLKSSGPFDTRSEPSEAVQSLIESATLRELKAEQVVFHHDVLHDWAVGCLLHDEPAFIDQLALGSPAPETLARGVEIAARLSIETSTDDTQWAALLTRLSQAGIHGSWRRAVLLALVRSEIGSPVLDRASKSLLAYKGKLDLYSDRCMSSASCCITG
jgi:energy-coupling factor transporter ATP-binding protein EcfA2